MCQQNDNPRKVSLGEFFDKNINNNREITIPRIQRDYAQGRIGKGYIREEFLRQIYTAVTSDKEHTLLLDFIYGYMNGNDFYPLDGQQRLTTLWLVYWYFAVRAAELNRESDNLSKFSYVTRTSSREFCKELCKADNMANYKIGDDLVEYIKDQHWFFSTWQKDPTISSMLRTIGGEDKKDGLPIKDGIQPVFENLFGRKDAWKKCLKRLKDRIKFYEFIIGEEDLPKESADQLYIKMNARGKALSDFEDFRADLIDHIDGVYHDEKDKAINISKKIDYEWSGIIWKDINRFIDSLTNSKSTNANQRKFDVIAADNLEKNLGRNTDELFFAFINRFCFGKLCVAIDSSGYRLNENLISLIDAIQDPEEESKLSTKQLEKLEAIRADEREKERKVLIQYDYLFADWDISYETYDMYEGLLPAKKSKNSLECMEYVLDALASDDWDEYIQKSLDDIVNRNLKKRMFGAKEYRFLPQYRRKTETLNNHAEERFKGNVATKHNKCGSTVGQIESIQLKERIYFFAISKYLETNYKRLDKEKYIDWLYFCRNVIENANISSVKAMISCIRRLDKYGNHSDNILEFLKQVKDDENIQNPESNKKLKEKTGILSEVDFEGLDYCELNYLDAQIAEEVQKAAKIYEASTRNKERLAVIREAENHACFCGCIRFLFLNGSFNEDWGNESLDRYCRRFNSVKASFKQCKGSENKDEFKVDFDSVKKFAEQYKDFKDVEDKYIFHSVGWAERGDSWLKNLCQQDFREKADHLLLGDTKPIAESTYRDFLNSSAFASIVNKTGLLTNKSDLHITKKGEHWICVKKSSENDYLIFDDDTFHRNEEVHKLIEKHGFYTVNYLMPYEQNNSYDIGDNYYWYKHIYIQNSKDKSVVYHIESNEKIYMINAKDGKEDRDHPLSYDDLKNRYSG